MRKKIFKKIFIKLFFKLKKFCKLKKILRKFEHEKKPHLEAEAWVQANPKP